MKLALLAVFIPAQAFAGPPRDLWDALREQSRPEGLLTFSAAGAAAGLASVSDKDLRDSLQANPPLGSSAANFGAFLGNAAFLFPAAGAVYLGGAYFKAGPIQEFGLMSLEALALSGIEVSILKYSVQRKRPDGSDRYSFPSGHASDSFSVASVAASQWGWKAGVPACLLASFVDYTRLEKNKHYLSDVIFGSGIGVVAGRAVWKVHNRAQPGKVSVEPIFGTDWAAVRVSF